MKTKITFLAILAFLFFVPNVLGQCGTGTSKYPTDNFTPANTGSVEAIVLDSWPGEYTGVNVLANKQYTFASSVTTDFITITNLSGTVLTSGPTPVTWSSGFTPGTIKFYLYTNSSCGTNQIGRIKYVTSVAVGIQGCNNAFHGLYPAATFVPSNTGNSEVIATDSWAGQYSNVQIETNKQYTFSTSIASDYITITDATGNQIYASGLSPLNWLSGNLSGTLRYYVHANSNCGVQEVGRSKNITSSTYVCALPTQVTVANITSNSAKLSWTAPAQVPTGGYDIYYSTTATAPTAATVPTTSVTTGTSKLINSLTANTAYYYWVRSNCSATSKGEWVGGTFTTLISLECNSAMYGLYPETVFTPSDNNTVQVIATDSWAGHYSNINVIPNRFYTFTSSVVGDHISITNEDGTILYATGRSPLYWTSGNNSGVFRYHIYGSNPCSSEQVARTKSIRCSAITTCDVPNNIQIIGITSNSATITWNAPTNSPTTSFYLSADDVPYKTNFGTMVERENSTSAVITALQPNTLYYYYVRSSCSQWISAGSFKTLANIYVSCNGAYYGKNPHELFVPQCTGNYETITDVSFASQYSDVTILADTQYTFQSQSGDYITVTNAEGTAVLAKSYTPLTWNSGSYSGTIRYYIHTNVACGGFESDARSKRIKCVPYCNTPSEFQISNIYAKSARLFWKQGVASSYQPYATTSNVAPTDDMPVENTITTNFHTFDLMPGTTYYLWVRSVCASGNSPWVSGGTVTTQPGGCNAISVVYPNASFTPACTGLPEVITTTAVPGHNSALILTANKTYVFESSVATDYLTITSDNSSVVYAYGTTPLTWTSTISGYVRFYLHTDDDCGTQGPYRIRTVKCAPDPVCLVPSALTVGEITSNSVKISLTAPSELPSNGYDIYYSTTNTSPTVGTTPTENFNSTSHLLRNLNSGASYYYWIRSNCGGLKSAWVGGTFNTLSFLACNGAYGGLFPAETFTPSCNGQEVISTTCLPSTYLNINIVPNKQYTFSSSVATDYITITNASGTVIYASGATPVVWNSSLATDVIRYYTHSSTNCGFENVTRTKFISCDLPVGCTTGTLFPEETFSPICSGTSALITQYAWAGEYSNINVIANQEYTFTSSINTDFVTISNADGSVILGRGTTPFTWTSTSAGVVRFYLHADGNCSVQETYRLKRMSCDTYCGLPSGLSAVNISPSTATLTWSAPDIAPQDYHMYYSTANTPPTGSSYTIVANGLSTNLKELNPNTTYYFWIRSNCFPGRSEWVQGSFTTTSQLACNNPVYGLYPAWTYTPSCNGVKETIITNAYASEYGYVNISDNKQYRFESSVSTDYITITNETGTVVHASGTTPLNWVSGSVSGTIRYFIHSNANCGAQATNRTKYITCAPAGACSSPAQAGVTQVASTAVRLAWTVPPTGIAIGYQVHIAPTNAAPSANLPTDLYVTNATNYEYHGLQPSQTYYYWIRSICTSGTSNWQLYGNFMTVAPGCIGGSVQFPPDTIVPVCGTDHLVTDMGLHGEYSNISVTASTNYTFHSGIQTDYITITNAAGTVVLGSGTTPLSWNSGSVSGTVRFYLSKNVFCDSDGGDYRFKYVHCEDPNCPNITPMFFQRAPICAGTFQDPLPVDSENGIHGTWSPALNTNATTTYTFTPAPGQCAVTTTMTIVVTNGNIVPTFAQVPAICQGSYLGALPVDSTNGIHGSWSPALNNMATTTYTFTPYQGQCAVPTTMTINVSTSPFIVPTFAQVSPICQGSYLAALPVDSTNGIHGAWTPALNNMATTTYTFTPMAGQCAVSTTMTVYVSTSPFIVPTFYQRPPICAGTFQDPLPVDSENGIHGSWSPALNTNATTTYTFTPAPGQCAVPATMTISVTNQGVVVPTFAQVPPICQGAYPGTLPVDSTNGIHGSWSPALNSTATTTYTFTPAPGQCAANTTMTIAIIEIPQAPTDVTACGAYTLPTLPNGYFYSGATNEGVSLTAGTPIFTSQMVYFYYDNLPCATQGSFEVNIQPVDNNIVSNGGTLAALMAGTGVTYQWYKCLPDNVAIPGATSQGFVPTETGSYQVKIVIPGCGSVFSDCVLVETLGLESNTFSSVLKLYPNPTNNVFTIDTGNETADEILFFDGLGRLLMQQVPVSGKTILNAGGYAEGIYYVKVKRGKQEVTKKLMLRF